MFCRESIMEKENSPEPDPALMAIVKPEVIEFEGSADLQEEVGGEVIETVEKDEIKKESTKKLKRQKMKEQRDGGM